MVTSLRGVRGPASAAGASSARRRRARPGVSTGGHSSRCQARLRTRTGTRASTTAAPGTRPGSRRSFQELEKSVSLSSVGSSGDQRLRQLVRVLADPCSLDERGTIVEQDAHAPAS